MKSTALSPGLVIQGIAPHLRLRDFRLIAFDMDSTLIDIECIDEIADVVGKGPAVAAITEAAMRGEIKSFKESLARRLSLLEGTPVSVVYCCFFSFKFPTFPIKYILFSSNSKSRSTSHLILRNSQFFFTASLFSRMNFMSNIILVSEIFSFRNIAFLLAMLAEQARLAY